MATGKRALIVDDSRSARVILSRMLEQHGMAVDTAESAEQALEFLQQARPDVIFMDHLMPGMDGFEAVQAIKSDPQTAMIPLMMYTSQEGELYVSQARALGAIGVLPKTVRPVDVARVLYQLHLLPERRTQRSALFDAAAAAARAAAMNPLGGAANDPDAPPLGTAKPLGSPEPAAAAPWPASPAVFTEMQAQLRQSTQQVVRDQMGEQRRFLLATFEAFARRLTNELREELARTAPAPVPEFALARPRRRWPAALAGVLALVLVAILGWLYWQALAINRDLSGELGKARAATAAAHSAAAKAIAALQAEPVLTAPEAEGAQGGAATAPTATDYVPYGETPFASGRLDRLRELAATLEAQQFRGRIRAEYFVGDFCLAGSSTEGYAAADAALPAPKCDLVGNPFDDSLSAAQHQSVDFANFAAMLRQRTAGAIVVEPVYAGRRSQTAYPESVDKATAGEWNATATLNNRVEFRVIPAA